MSNHLEGMALKNPSTSTTSLWLVEAERSTYVALGEVSILYVGVRIYFLEEISHGSFHLSDRQDSLLVLQFPL
jgi:hypothetical protein